MISNTGFQPPSDELILEIKNEGADSSSGKEKQEKVFTIQGLFNSVNDWMIERSTVSIREKVTFFQLLGAMNHAGVPITESLQILSKQTKNLKMKYVIKDMYEFIEGGESLASSMRRNSDLFDEATCSVIEAGEKSGKLNEVVKELSKQFETMSSVSKKIKSVMLYPVIVFTVMIILTAVVMIFVVPKLMELFGTVDQLPLPTRMMIWMSDFFIQKWWLLIIIVVALVSGIISFKNSKSGKRILGIVYLNLPILSGLVCLSVLTRVTRILGFLIQSGVPIVKSLRIAADVAENQIYKEKFLLAADDLTKGIPIAENLADNEKLFPPMLVGMIAIGENTASLENIMSKVADYYYDEFDTNIKNLSQILEPIILFVIAGCALFLITAIFLPLLKMNEVMIKG